MLKHAQRSAPTGPGAGAGAGAAEGADGELPPRYQNMPRRLLHHHLHLPLNVSTLDSSKHSVGGTSPSVSPAAAPGTPGTPAPLRPAPLLQPPPSLPNGTPAGAGAGAPAPRSCARAATEEALTSLALLCLASLLLALLALLFLLRVSPGGVGTAGAGAGAAGGAGAGAEELAVVHEVALALCALTLSLDLCCLLVCAIQFLFAVKLVHAPPPAPLPPRSNKYLQKAAATRVCAIAGFFISIPVFLTGIILYTCVHFQSTPAIVSGVLVGAGIVFCGAAMLHNVFVWQREKTCVLRALNSTLAHAHAAHAAHTPAAHTHAANTHAANTYANHVHNLTHTSLNTSNGLIITGMGNGAGVGGWTAAPGSRARSMLLHAPQPPQPHAQPPYTIRPPTSTPPGGEGVPAATLDLSRPDHDHDPHELSTLV